MGRKCTVCEHPHRARVDQELVIGESIRTVAQRHHLNPSAVYRHSLSHIPKQHLAERRPIRKYRCIRDTMLGGIHIVPGMIWETGSRLPEPEPGNDDWIRVG